jgi:virginiamycin A acetyltransferase
MHPKNFFYKNRSIVKSKTSRIEKNVILAPRNNTRIVIGEHSSINGPNTHILSYFNDIIIGNYCSIAMGVKIIEYNHRHSSLSTSRILKLMENDLKSDYKSKGSIIIGSDVWIGMDCHILSGVKIGDGAVISSNSTVTKDIPAFSIVGGSPARVLKMRYSEDIIEILQKIQWWNYGLDELIPYQNIFRKDKLSLEDVKLLQLDLRNNL